VIDDRTIVAPATPRGEGGLAVIRLSGSGARDLLLQVFRPKNRKATLPSHQLTYGHVFAGEELVDEVMAVIMLGPRTFTREDVAEIHCHGGPVTVQRILELLIQKGADLAKPGEFTLRAFMNGRLDLAQAEAVADLIHSRSEAAQRVALGQLDGQLSRRLHAFRSELLHLLALVEAHIDFLDDDIEPPDMRELGRQAAEVAQEIQLLMTGFSAGRLLQEGLRILILGKPNVGKSSLLNALLGQSRAIVTALAGTTRDTIEESLVLDGLPVRLIDTAGLRQTEDQIEMEGVSRARDKVVSADLVLLVVDGSRPVDADDLLALQSCPVGKTLLVVNKADLPQYGEFPATYRDLPSVFVGAKDEVNLLGLVATIKKLVVGSGFAECSESTLVYERRHFQALTRAHECLGRFLKGCGVALGYEFLAMELREALSALGEITGETTPDQVLDEIFSRFCIGK
jgi:tRNA modification GTPase